MEQIQWRTEEFEWGGFYLSLTTLFSNLTQSRMRDSHTACVLLSKINYLRVFGFEDNLDFSSPTLLDENFVRGKRQHRGSNPSSNISLGW